MDLVQSDRGGRGESFSRCRCQFDCSGCHGRCRGLGAICPVGRLLSLLCGRLRSSGTLFGGHLESPGRDPALHPLLRCRLRAFGDNDRFTPRRGDLYNCASSGGNRHERRSGSAIAHVRAALAGTAVMVGTLGHCVRLPRCGRPGRRCPAAEPGARSQASSDCRQRAAGRQLLAGLPCLAPLG